MGATFAQITALLFSAAILLMGNGLQVTLLPLRAQFEAFSTVQIGTIGSAYYAGFAAGCFWARWAPWPHRSTSCSGGR